MKIRLLVTGKTEESFIKTGIREYVSRINHYIPFEIVEIQSLKNSLNRTITEQKAQEAVLIKKQIYPGNILVLLDEHGKELTSIGFATFLNRLFSTGGKTIVFLVGGPYGFDESLRKRADHILSLSRMTFSHQMVRLFFTEQFYRAMTILRGESYHHE